MFTLLYFVAMAGNILIQLGGVNADPCTSLRTCINNMEFNTTSGTWSFINSRPSTKTSWTNQVKPICDTLSTRKVCSTSETCTNQTDLNKYEVVKKKATFMCTTNGRSFLERIYDEASSCIGNSTKTQQATTNRQNCKTTYLNQITSSMTTAQKCTKVHDTRNCDRNYVGEMCGDLFRWVIDQSWKAYIEVHHTDCLSSLSTFSFPAETSG